MDRTKHNIPAFMWLLETIPEKFSKKSSVPVSRKILAILNEIQKYNVVKTNFENKNFDM